MISCCPYDYPASCTCAIICIEDLIRGNETRARESDLKDDDDDTVMVRAVLSRSKMSFEYCLQPRLNPTSNTNDVQGQKMLVST